MRKETTERLKGLAVIAGVLTAAFLLSAAAQQIVLAVKRTWLGW